MASIFIIVLFVGGSPLGSAIEVLASSPAQAGSPVTYGTLTGKLINVKELPPATGAVGTFEVPFNSPVGAREYDAAKLRASQPGYVPPQDNLKNKVGPSLGSPQLTTQPTTQYPTITTSWAGMGASGATPAGLSAWPPDVNGAVGPNHVVEIVNEAYAVYSKAGALLAGPVSLQSFWGLTSTDSVGDTMVIYDAISDRWFMTAEDFTLNPASNIELAVTSSNDPTAGWFTFPNTVSVAGCRDQPFTGTNDDKWGITYNLYATVSGVCFGGFLGSVWVMINKIQLLGCSGLSCTANFATATITSSVFTLRPARHLSSTSGVNPTNCFYLGDMAGGGTTSFRVYEVCGLPPTTTSVSFSNVFTIAALSIPPNAPQPSTSNVLDTGDYRIRSIAWQMLSGLGILWVADNDGCTPSGDITTRSCLRIEAVETDPGFSGPRQEYEYSSNGRYYFYPALSLNQHGDLMFTAGVSSSTVRPSMIESGRLSTETTGAFESETTLFAGTASVTASCATCRYGDYFGAGTDPSDEQSFWFFGEYITDGTTQAKWSTGIAHAVFQQSYLLMASSQLWDSSGSIGASMSICRDGSRIAGDLFNLGPTPANRHLATAYTLDYPNIGSHTYSLCFKTDPGGTGFVSGTFLGLAPMATMPAIIATPIGGDESTTSTTLTSAAEFITSTGGSGLALIFLLSSEQWDSAASGAGEGICKDGVLLSGEMQAIGASSSARDNIAAIARDVSDGASHTYTACFRTLSGGTTAFISSTELVGFFLGSVPSGISGVGGAQSTASTSFTASGQTVTFTADGVSQYVILAASMIYDSSSSIGASIAICKDAFGRVSGDLFTVGATSTNILVGGPIFIDEPLSGSHTYSLCYKTDSSGTATINHDSILYFRIATTNQPIALLSGPHGDQGTTSTTFTPSLEQLLYFVGGNQPQQQAPTAFSASQPIPTSATQTQSQGGFAPRRPQSN